MNTLTVIGPLCLLILFTSGGCMSCLVSALAPEASKQAEISTKISEAEAKGDYQEAIAYRKMLLNLCHPTAFSCRLDVKEELAGDYFMLGQYEEAVQYYIETLKYTTDIDSTMNLLTKIDHAYTALGCPDKAIGYREQALKIGMSERLFDHCKVCNKIEGQEETISHVGYHQKGILAEAKSLAAQASLNASFGFYEQAFAQYDAVVECMKCYRKLYGDLERIKGSDFRANASEFEIGANDLTTRIWQEKGALYLSLKDYAKVESSLIEAEKWEDEVRQAYEKSRMSLGLKAGLLAMGGLFVFDIMKDERVSSEKAVRFLRDKRQPLLVDLYLATGRYNEARALLERIAASQGESPTLQIRCYTQNGTFLKATGKLPEASEAYLHAFNIIEGLRGQLKEERTGFLTAENRMSAYRGLVATLAERARRGEKDDKFSLYGKDLSSSAFYFAESTKARTLIEKMAESGKKAGNIELPEAMRTRELALTGQISVLNKEEESIHTRTEGQVKVFKERKAKVISDLSALIAELWEKYPRYAAFHYPRPVKAEMLPLHNGEVLLEYSLGDKTSYLFRVEPGGRTEVFRLNLGQEELEKRLSALLAPFRQGELTRDNLKRFTVKVGSDLYRQLLSPALQQVPADTRVIIVPDGVLGAFPFEALVVKESNDWNDSVLVGDRWQVSYAQSASVLALNRLLGPSKAGEPLFALGDCVYSSDTSRYQAYKAGKAKAGEIAHAGTEMPLSIPSTRVEWGKLEFPPLPMTRETVKEIAAQFEIQPQAPQVLMDVLATETQLRQVSLERYRYLFFGTHGFLADKMSGVQEPVLVLTQVENKEPDDGFLTMSEVMDLRLDADLVTLAACVTGVGSVMQGEGVVNFARAFQQAGARSVMVSLWNIPVKESMEFYRFFYQALRKGQSRLEALKEARRLIRTKEPHPYFWSGIILHGEG